MWNDKDHNHSILGQQKINRLPFIQTCMYKHRNPLKPNLPTDTTVNEQNLLEALASSFCHNTKFPHENPSLVLLTSPCILMAGLDGCGEGLLYPSNCNMASAAWRLANFLLGPTPVQTCSSTCTYKTDSYLSWSFHLTKLLYCIILWTTDCTFLIFVLLQFLQNSDFNILNVSLNSLYFRFTNI